MDLATQELVYIARALMRQAAQCDERAESLRLDLKAHKSLEHILQDFDPLQQSWALMARQKTVEAQHYRDVMEKIGAEVERRFKTKS